MSDPKNPETDTTTIITGRESKETKADEPRKAEEEPGLETVVIPPPKAGSSESAPAGGPPAESASHGADKEKTRKETPPGGSAGKPPSVPPGGQKPPSGKGGGGTAALLGIILLLAVGAGAYLYLQDAGQGWDLSRWLPFKSGADRQQESAQTGSGGQGTPSEPSAKHQWVQAGMPAQVVRDIMGEPLRVVTVDQTLRWEYDTGTELFVVSFQEDKVYEKGMEPYPPAVVDAGAQAPSASASGQDAQTLPGTATLAVSNGTAAGTGEEQAAPQQDPRADRYGHVQLGMTPDAVRNILGEPSSIKKTGQSVGWKYDTGTGTFDVMFKQNKVASKGMSPYDGSQPAAASSPSSSQPAQPEATPAASDYDRIKVGMTPEAVTQILGKPAQIKKLRTAIEWEYNTPQGVFEVRFRNKRVSFTGMEPHKGTAAPAGKPAN